MAIDFPVFDEYSLLDSFDPGAISRGQDYYERSMVRSLDWSPSNGQLTGVVQGSGNARYRVNIELSSPDAAGEWDVDSNECTCPVGYDCKHVVAVCLEAIDRADWEGPGDSEKLASRFLNEDLSEDPHEALLGWGARTIPRPDKPHWSYIVNDFRSMPGDHGDKATDIALSVDIQIKQPTYNFRFHTPENRSIKLPDLSTAQDNEFTVVLRPLRKSEAGNWVKNKMSWSVFDHSYLSRPDINKQQFLALSQLHKLAVDQAWLYTNDIEMDAAQWNLVDLWSLFREVIDSGVPLVGQGELRTIEIADAAEFTMDLSTSNSLKLIPRIKWRGEFLENPILVGNSAIMQLEESSDKTPGHKGRIHARFIPLKKAMRFHFVDLLKQDSFLEIPREEEPQFFEDFYPSIRNAIPVVSTDNSTKLPEKKLPVLAATIDISRRKLGDQLLLQWRWQHTQFGNPIEHKEAVLEAVRGVYPEAFLHTSSLSDQLITGAKIPRFVEHAVDKLDALEHVEVVFNSERPVYRELSGEPFVSISTEATDNDWFDLNFDIAIADIKVPFSSVFIALSTGEDNVLLDDGSYFSLDHPSFDALRSLLIEAQDLEEWDAKSQRVHRSNAGLFEDLSELADEWAPDVALESWMSTVRELAKIQELPHAEVPETLHATLRPYQEDGFRWLVLLHDLGLGGILADDMGLGKTIQTLALIAHTRETARKSVREAADTMPVSSGFLVVAPSSVLSVWRDEAAKFVPHLTVEVLDKTAAKRKSPMPMDADIVITSYAIARIDEELLAAQPWQGIIVDEAQFIKNHTTRSFRAIRTIAQRARFRLAITGTPMENSLSDLWSLIALTAPGLFPKFKDFKTQFINPIESGSELAAERMAHLRRRITPFMLRRAKEDVATDLPEKIENTVVLPLEAPHRMLYDAVLQRERKKVLRLLDDNLDANRMSIFRSLTLLRMLALDPYIVDEAHASIPSTKLDDLLERLEVLTKGEDHQVIVFSQFTSFLKRISERLDESGISYAYLDGSTRNRSAAIKEFREDGASVFLISLKSGGFGLTLTEADYVFLLDPWWNPAAENQAIDRAHRIGQTTNVMVYRMVSEGTIEEKVLQLQKKKSELFDALTTGSTTASSGLTADDVRQLFSVD